MKCSLDIDHSAGDYHLPSSSRAVANGFVGVNDVVIYVNHWFNRN